MPGVEDRNIGLGRGFQTVEGRGVAVVVLPEAMLSELISEERFTFRAKLYDSTEELQKNFSAALSVSAGAYAADLGANANTGSATDFSRFGAYYMMELEFRKGRCMLGVGAEALEPSIRDEIEQLDSPEKWAEFYRANGDHVVCSVTYGRKLIIIVSLSHKVRSHQLRRMLEAKAGFTAPMVAKGALEMNVESNLQALAEENISSVQIHSIGDSDPNFLREIDKLGALKDKIRRFVNSAAAQPVENHSVEEAPTHTASTIKDKGVIIAYTTCSYIDFLNKQSPKIRDITAAYDWMLQHTNRASRYLEAIALCLGRIDLLIRNVTFFLSGHEGAFVLDAVTEEAAGLVIDILKKHAITLRGAARDVVAEVSGLSEEGRSYRVALAEAKESLGLLDELNLSHIDAGRENVQQVLDMRWKLIEKFELLICDKGGKEIALKARLKTLQTVVSRTDEEKKGFLKQVDALKLEIERKTAPFQRDRAVLLRDISPHFQLAIQSLRRQKKEGVATSEMMQLFEKLKQVVTQTQYQNRWVERITSVCRAYDATRSPVTDGKKQKSEPVADAYSMSSDQLELQELLQRVEQLFDVSPRYHYSLAYPLSSAELLSAIERMLDTAQLYLPDKETKDIVQRALLLKEQGEAMFLSLSQAHIEACDAFRLKPEELQIIKEICTDYIQEVTAKELSKKWWEDHWEQIYNISIDLDGIANNTMPPSAPLAANKVCAAIDFQHEGYLVGVFTAKRGQWFDKEHFNGETFQQLLVPITTRFLRFKVEGANAPKVPVEFNLMSKTKVRFGEHQTAHRTLYRQIQSNNPVYPLQKSMQEVADLLGPSDSLTLTRGEALMHGENETKLYRKVRVRDVRFLCSPNDVPVTCQEVSIRIFAQMSKGLDSLDLPKLPPKGKADYGIRFKSVSSASGLAVSERPQLRTLATTLTAEQTGVFHRSSNPRAQSTMLQSQSIFRPLAHTFSSQSLLDEEAVRTPKRIAK